METAITIQSPNTGPIITILGGIHGNEKPGINALNYLISNKEKINLKRGTVHLIFGNPKAIELNKRQTDANLNRLFRDNLSDDEKNSYEFSRSQLIREFLDQSDLCLDLHASSSQVTAPFAITEKNSFDLVKNFPVKTVVTNINNFEPGGSDGYIYNIGKMGICIECGYLDSEDANQIALLSIFQCLDFYGMLETTELSKAILSQKKVYSKQKFLECCDLYQTRTDNFTLNQPWADFELIPAGTVIANDGQTPISYPEEFTIIFARNRNAQNSEGFLRLRNLN